MNTKRALAIATCCVVALASAWTFLVVNYESDLGTKNTIVVSDAEANVSASCNDPLVVLGFSGDAEDLQWSSVHLQLITDTDSHTCSFGSHSSHTGPASKVQASLGADGMTFTTVIDASNESTFTHLDVPSQKATDEHNSTLRFSKTDVFLADDTRWAFVEAADFQDVTEYNATTLSNQTEERLDWYTYNIAEHRIQPNDGVYVIEQKGMMYKMQFLSYYNQEDESRHPTLLIAALNGSMFPALSDSNLVERSPCVILVGDGNTSIWASNATITLVENGVEICSAPCAIEVRAVYQTLAVEVKGVQTIR